MRPFEASAIQVGAGLLSVFFSLVIRGIRESIEELPDDSKEASFFPVIFTSFISGFIIFGYLTLATIGFDSNAYPFSILYLAVLFFLNSLINFYAINVTGLLYLDCAVFGFFATLLGSLGAVGIYRIMPYLTVRNFLIFLAGALVLGLLIRGLIFFLRGV